MKRISLVFALVAVLASPMVHGQQAGAVEREVDAANQLLPLADANDGASTWDKTASSF